MGALAVAVAYVFFQVGTVLNYQWKWAALPRFFIRFDTKTLSWVPNLLLLGLMTTLRLSLWGSLVAIVVGIVFVFGVGLHINPQPAALIPVVLTVLDALGYGLIMTALVVRVASIGAISHVGTMAIMAFGGTLVPITFFPHGMEVFARFIPTSLGVEAINSTLAGHGLGATWADGTLPWLLVHTAVVLTAGFSLYAINMRHAQREGGLRPR